MRWGAPPAHRGRAFVEGSTQGLTPVVEDFSAFLAAKPAALSVHFVAAAVAFGSGVCVFATPKGTRRHRMVGRVFVAAILVAALTGFLIYEIFGRISPFHLLSVFTLVTVIGGVRAIRKATPREKQDRAGGAVSAHINRMSWCFAALIIAAVVEALRLLPPEDQPAELFGVSGQDLIARVAIAMSVIAWVGITSYTLWIRFRKAAWLSRRAKRPPLQPEPLDVSSAPAGTSGSTRGALSSRMG